MDFNKPLLVEPGIKYYLGQTLKQCKEFREKYYNFIINMVIFVIFLIILLSILYSKYKGRLSPEEIERKNKEKHQYILSKIKMMQDLRKKEGEKKQGSMFTDLPQWTEIY